MHPFIQKIRPYSPEKSIKKDRIVVIMMVLFGAFLGFIAKVFDHHSTIGDIGQGLGIWVFIASLMGVYSRSPFIAAWSVLLFFIGMLGGYYLYDYYALNTFPEKYFIGWLIFALLSPLAGFIVWFAKGAGIIGSLVTALPVSILFAASYSAFYTYDQASTVLTFLFGVALLFILPAKTKQKGWALLFSLFFACIIHAFDLLRLFPF